MNPDSRDRDRPDRTIHAERVQAEIRDVPACAGCDVEKVEKGIDAGSTEIRRRLDTDGNVAVNGSLKRRLACGEEREDTEGDDPTERTATTSGSSFPRR